MSFSLRGLQSRDQQPRAATPATRATVPGPGHLSQLSVQFSVAARTRGSLCPHPTGPRSCLATCVGHLLPGADSIAKSVPSSLPVHPPLPPPRLSSPQGPASFSPRRGGSVADRSGRITVTLPSAVQGTPEPSCCASTFWASVRHLFSLPSASLYGSLLSMSRHTPPLLG